MKYSYRAFAVSDAGNVKEINQDSYTLKMAYYNDEPVILATVADGMGGTTSGEEASQKVKEAFEQWFKKNLEKIIKNDEISDALIESWDKIIFSISDDLIDKYGEGTAPGTTLTQILLYKGHYYAINIGDSRIYKLEDNELYQVTKDHSWVQDALDSGMKPEEINRDHRRNMITRCIGVSSDFNSPDYYMDEYKPGDRFLLCSDGLRHTIRAVEIKEALICKKNAKTKAQDLVSLAKKRGETDNITAIIIEIGKGGAKTAEIKEKK